MARERAYWPEIVRSGGPGELHEVVGSAGLHPGLRTHFLNATQQELAEASFLFDLPEHRLDDLASSVCTGFANLPASAKDIRNDNRYGFRRLGLIVAVHFGMERIAFDVEALHLGLFDPDALLVGPLVEGALGP